MAIVIVQQTAKGGSAAGPQTYTLNGCTAGNTLILQGYKSGTNTTIPIPTGWKQAVQSSTIAASGRFVATAVFYLSNIAAGTNAVTINWSANFQDAIMYEVSGLGTLPLVDVSSTNTGTTSPATTNTTASTLVATELAIAQLGWDDNGTASLGLTPGGTGTWTQLFADTNTAVASAGSGLYQILSSVGTQNAQWTVAGSPWASNGYSASIVTLIPNSPSIKSFPIPPPGRKPGKQPAPNRIGNTYAATALSPDVTVSLTGQSATFSAGTLADYITVAMTGQGATFATGNLGDTETGALLGQAATFSAGNVTPNTTIALTGQQSTFSAGTILPSTAIGLTGQSATFSAGTVSISGDVTVAISGQAATFSAGALSPSSSLVASGQAASFSSGSLAPSVSPLLSGSSASYSTGSMSVSINVPATGSIAAFGAGNVSALVPGDVTVALTGQSATFSTGSLSALLDTDIGGDPPRRKKTRNVIKNGKFVQEKIPNWPFDQQAPQTEQIEVRTAPSTKPVQIATDEDIVHATINLMFEMM